MVYDIYDLHSFLKDQIFSNDRCHNCRDKLDVVKHFRNLKTEITGRTKKFNSLNLTFHPVVRPRTKISNCFTKLRTLVVEDVG